MPGWLAVTAQPPLETIVTLLPETVQTLVVDDEKLTERPELALALTVNGAWLEGTLLRGAKLMVWFVWLTWKLCVTVTAGA